MLCVFPAAPGHRSKENEIRIGARVLERIEAQLAGLIKSS